MRVFWALVKRELTAYFLSPMAFIFLFSFLLMQGIHFSLILQLFAQHGSQVGRNPLQLFMWGLTFFYLLIIIPCITMRLLSEERRSGTLEVLMTAPVTDTQVVAAKFLGAFLLYCVLWATTGVFLGILAAHSKPDWGQVAAAYLGVLLYGGVLLAIGLFCSSMTQNQISSAILAIAANFAVWLLGFFLKGQPWAGDDHKWGSLAFKFSDVLGYINFQERGEDFAAGFVDSRQIVFCLSVVLFFLFAAVKTTESRRWR